MPISSNSSEEQLHTFPHQLVKELFVLFGLIAVVVLIVLSFSWFSSQFMPVNNLETSLKVEPQKKIGILQSTVILDQMVAGFKEELSGRGYKEGEQVVYEYQNADNDTNKMAQIAREYIDKEVDLLLVLSSPATEIALKEVQISGKNIPVIFGASNNSDIEGIIKSLQSSGNVATGVANNFEDLVAKQLDMIKRINPNIKKVGVLSDGFILPQGPGALVLARLKAQASRFGLSVVEYKTKLLPGPSLRAEAQQLLNTIKSGDIDVLLHLPAHFITDQQILEAETARRLKIISMMPAVEEIEEGPGLVAYGFDFYASGKQGGVMADKVFKGVNPSDIPIEFPRKYYLAFNMKTSREIGIHIPDSLLQIADQVIQ